MLVQMRPLIASLIALIILLGIFTLTPSSEGLQEPIIHIVAPGETLWEIAKEYYPKRDVREVVWEIRKHNNISPMLGVGQEIRIP